MTSTPFINIFIRQNILTLESREVSKTLNLANPKTRLHNLKKRIKWLRLAHSPECLEISHHYNPTRTNQNPRTDYTSVMIVCASQHLDIGQRRWVELVGDYRCDIRYRPGQRRCVQRNKANSALDTWTFRDSSMGSVQ